MDIEVGFEAMLVAQATPRSLELAMMFGLRLDGAGARQVIVPKVRVRLPRDGIVFITGPSGGGKSTLLRQLAGKCAAAGVKVWSIGAHGAIESPEERAETPAVFQQGRPLIDAHGLSLAQAAEALSTAGLGEAAIMLRTPGELSDGQRWRLGLAEVIARMMRMDHTEARDRSGGEARIAIVADEFGATLDRLTAMALARSMRRWLHRRAARGGSPACAFLCATTHDDLLEALDPDVLVFKGFGADMAVERRGVKGSCAVAEPREGSSCGAI